MRYDVVRSGNQVGFVVDRCAVIGWSWLWFCAARWCRLVYGYPVSCGEFRWDSLRLVEATR